jgi:ribonuclease P protein component
VSNLSFSKTLRLLNSHDFKQVFDNAKIKVSNAEFLILACRSEHSHPRLGLIIAKKNVRLAVHRNRIKRIIRDGFRKHQHDLSNIDIIVLAKRGVDRLDNASVHEKMDKLWHKVAQKAAK